MIITMSPTTMTSPTSSIMLMITMTTIIMSTAFRTMNHTRHLRKPRPID